MVAHEILVLVVEVRALHRQIFLFYFVFANFPIFQFDTLSDK